jgi:hypothetical protein
MTKKIKSTKKDVVVLKKYSSDEVKDRIIRGTLLDEDLQQVISQLGNDLFPKHFDGNKKEREESKKETVEKTVMAMMALETETHVGITESFTNRYRGMVRQLCSQIIKEYQCNSNLEKTLVEIVVNSFVRTIDNSRRLNNELECREITKNRNVYIANISKQLDRSNRQYLSSLMTLKQLKAPNIEMNIKATTAFISQNQQINVDKENNEAK